MRAKDNRCGGVKNKNKGLGSCGRKDAIENNNTVCGLMWGVWFTRVVEEGVLSLW